MKQRKTVTRVFSVLCALTIGMAAPAYAQLGRQQGLVEPNVATDSAMLALPRITADIVQTLKTARPILSIVTLDSILGAGSLTRQQRTELFARMFVHVDINRGTDAEFMLIPGVDANKLRALKAGRPWKTMEQFQTEITRATNAAEATRLEQYFFIPIDLNTWTDPIMDTFLSIGVGTTRWKTEFAEYRPWTSMAQFEQRIGRYVRSNPSELKRLARYVIINP